MDVSLDELIKQKKVAVPKRRPVQQKKPQQVKRLQQGQQLDRRQQPVGDARDRISGLRKKQLVGADARQRIEQRKRLGIRDARDMLTIKQQLQQAQPRAAPGSGVPTGVALPKKVVPNELFQRRPPAPPPQLEYEDDDEPPYAAQPTVRRRAPPPPQLPPHHQPRAMPLPGRGGREIPVQVSQRQRQQLRDRSRSPVAQRRHAPPPPPPPASHPGAVMQAYKVSISNLHPGVTREDIYELFSSVGTVKKCVLLREGAAEVVYPSKDHAMAAVRRYDRRELDGMPMQLRLTVVGIKVSSSSSRTASGAAAAAAAAVDERAVRAALFRGATGGGGGGSSRPVNFQVSM